MLDLLHWSHTVQHLDVMLVSSAVAVGIVYLMKGEF